MPTPAPLTKDALTKIAAHYQLTPGELVKSVLRLRAEGLEVEEIHARTKISRLVVQAVLRDFEPAPVT